jgi:hypothetical protein
MRPAPEGCRDGESLLWRLRRATAIESGLFKLDLQCAFHVSSFWKDTLKLVLDDIFCERQKKRNSKRCIIYLNPVYDMNCPLF